jgi:hypothetical protein
MLYAAEHVGLVYVDAASPRPPLAYAFTNGIGMCVRQRLSQFALARFGLFIWHREATCSRRAHIGPHAVIDDLLGASGRLLPARLFRHAKMTATFALARVAKVISVREPTHPDDFTRQQLIGRGYGLKDGPFKCSGSVPIPSALKSRIVVAAMVEQPEMCAPTAVQVGRAANIGGTRAHVQESVDPTCDSHAWEYTA